MLLVLVDLTEIYSAALDSLLTKSSISTETDFKISPNEVFISSTLELDTLPVSFDSNSKNPVFIFSI